MARHVFKLASLAVLNGRTLTEDLPRRLVEPIRAVDDTEIIALDREPTMNAELEEPCDGFGARARRFDESHSDLAPIRPMRINF